MCLYPRLIKNRKYLINKKNKGNVPTPNDERVKYVSIGCGKCIECTKKRARDWKVRLNEEIRVNNKAKFVTLTFDEKNLKKYKELVIDYPEEEQPNEIATLAIRHFLERWRKEYKKSVKHWLITELGHTGTERIHIHGILWTEEDNKTITKLWKNGYTYTGQYVNEKTINYISKYVTKIDIQHKWFTGKILTSAGIGSNYTKRPDSNKNKFKHKDTNELYTTRTGTKLPLPIYYRNKIYTEEEREKLWTIKLDQEIRYIEGKKIDVSTDEGIKLYEKALEEARKNNIKMGYGKIDWDSEIYKKSIKKIKYLTKQLHNKK